MPVLLVRANPERRSAGGEVTRMQFVPSNREGQISRRSFVQVLGAGLLIGVSAPALEAQSRRGGRGGRGGFMGRGAATIAARVHIAKDGAITVMAGKVEAGQGARAELTQVAAEELRLSADRVALILADTALVPDDGMTAGSGTTPRTVPAVRAGAAAARELLVALACQQWNANSDSVQVHDGRIIHPQNHRELTYADLAAKDDLKSFAQPIPAGVTVTPVAQWKVMGTPVARPNRRDLVTGAHQYPSDISRSGMLYGKVLRLPSYGAKLTAIDLSPAQKMKDVAVTRDGDFVGVAAPTRFLAEQALAAAAKTASWQTASSPPSSEQIFDYLREHTRGGVPSNPFADDLANAAKSLKQTYHVAYIQHAPLEPRAAVAEWTGDKLTVWTGTQNPFGVQNELAGALNVPPDHVRVIVPDFGGGFGGKHSGEAAVEAARLAKAVGRPVSLRWTREEEFTWAYFRPAGVIDLAAGLDPSGAITAWHHVNINSGPSSMNTPYRIAKARSQFVQTDSPLRSGSYRALAATANTFARECFMDELAAAAGRDPLEFRLAHLEDARLRDVLEAAAKQFDWNGRAKQKQPGIGVGLACGTEKGSYVATCAQVAADRQQGTISVHHVCQVFECGAVINPDNLTAQNQGAIVMGLGAALREQMRFEGGAISNASFRTYLVPRFRDVPDLDVHLLNRPDLQSAGAGETPIIGIAPAVANAVFAAIGVRIREMPMRLPSFAAVQ